MARVAITLFDAQQLPVSADSFQQDLVARLDRAKLDLQSVSGDKVREDLTQLKQLLVERWAYVEEKAVQTGRPLSEAFAERLAEIKPRMSAPEAVQLLERFIADMSDGHSYLSCGGVERLGLPFRMRDTSDGVVIEALHPEAANLERGDRVASISDLPIEKWIAWQKEITSCSTAAARRAWAIRNMSTMLVRNENQNDQSQSIESVIVAVERDGDLKRVDCKLTGEGSWASADSQVWLQTKDLSSRTGYIKVQSWSPEIVGADSEAASRLRTDIDRAIDKYMSASAIVVDIRGNRGGYDWLCTYFASHFIKAPFPVYALRYRLNDQGFGNVNLEPTLSGVTYAAYKGECFAGQIYVLVDENCFSASDVFLSVVKAQLPDRATLIGRPNAGGVGGPNLMGTLKHTGAAVTLSRCKAFHCNGSKLLEGTSAEIDYLVEWTRQDILKSRDPDLEKALALIEAEFTVE
jgi:C-terminal processing protease CtpA/Prc